MSKIEKKFFKTFCIKERELEYPDNFTYYPEITDRILLELICLGSIFEVVSNKPVCLLSNDPIMCAQLSKDK